MTKSLHGVIHGRTIELADDPGLIDGEEVVVDVRPVSMPAAPGDAVRRTAGALTEDPYWDEILRGILSGRQVERGAYENGG